MKEYKGYFRSCDTSVDENGQLFRVSIYTNFSNSTTSTTPEIITLTDEPFVVEYEGDSNNFQKPYKCSTATVNFLYNTYNSDFSNTNANNMLVVLSKWRNNNWCEEGELENTWHYSYNTPTRQMEGSVTSTEEFPSSYHCWEITWIGYGTPNTYNQGFESVFDEVSINAQDALSTLKYVDYEPINFKRGVVSFSDIIKKYVKRLGTYKYIYITDALVVRTTDEQDILHALYIHENDFFDEDDKPMKVMEVLENICQYLHITVIPYGDALYFVSYDSISEGYNIETNEKLYKDGFNDYYLWKCNDSQNFSIPYLVYPEYTKVSGTFTLIDYHEIKKNDFAENGTSLNVLDAFGKVTVKDDLYPYSSIIPELENDKYVKNSTLSSSTGLFFDDIDTIRVMESSQNEVLIATTFMAQTEYHRLFMKYLKYLDNYSSTSSNSIKMYQYPKDTINSSGELEPVETPRTISGNPNWNISETMNSGGYIGCGIIDYKAFKFKYGETVYITSVDMERNIVFFQAVPEAYSSQNRGDGLAKNVNYELFFPYTNPTQPMVEFSSNDVVMDKNTLFKIEGTYEFFGRNLPIPVDVSYNDIKNHKDYCFVWARFKCGNKYWDGVQWNRAGQGSTFFQIPIEYEEDKKAFYTDFKIVSCKLDEKAKNYEDYYTIPSPITDDNTYLNDIKLTLYRTASPAEKKISPLVLLKNFDLSVIQTTNFLGFNLISKDNGSNIEYSDNLNETVNSKEIEDYPDIDNKISTWRNKYPNYSNVLVSPYFYEDGYNNVSNHTFNRLYGIYCKGIGDVFIPENQITSSINKQYSKPTITLNINLKESLEIKPWCILTYHYFPNYIFMVNSMSYDYRWNKQTINILHKYVLEEEIEEGDIYANTR